MLDSGKITARAPFKVSDRQARIHEFVPKKGNASIGLCIESAQPDNRLALVRPIQRPVTGDKSFASIGRSVHPCGNITEKRAEQSEKKYLYLQECDVFFYRTLSARVLALSRRRIARRDQAHIRVRRNRQHEREL